MHLIIIVGQAVVSDLVVIAYLYENLITVAHNIIISIEWFTMLVLHTLSLIAI